jgi:CSLREA domain-containing protein
VHRLTEAGTALRRSFVCLVAGVLASLGLVAAPAHSATLTVTKTTDTNDGTCNADCSLREAIVAANAAGGADTIEIPSGHYRLRLEGDDDTAAAGDLDITSELTLKAVGSATIDGSRIDRVVHVLAAGNAKILGVRIANGQALADGGGLYNLGTTTLTRSAVSGNAATTAGGIFNQGDLTLANSSVNANLASEVGGIYNSGTVTLDGSAVRRNTANNGKAGGIRNEDTVTLTNSTVSGNEALTEGGGIYNNDDTKLVDSTVNGNEAAKGGGIYNNQGTMSLSDSLVESNQAPGGEGGGVFNDGTITLTKSTVSDNEAQQGGGMSTPGAATLISSVVKDNFAGVGAGIYYSFGELSLVRSAVTGNSGAGVGAGIATEGLGSATVERSVISGNAATNAGGGIASINVSNLEVTKSTISGNTVDGNNPTGGGGIFASSDGLFTITDSTVSENSTEGNGGGIHNSVNGSTIVNSTISNNSAENGGGLFTQGNITVTNSTISANRADFDGDNNGDGGGVFLLQMSFAFGNSIIAGNSDGSGTTHPDLSCLGGTLVSNDHNLIGDVTGCNGFFMVAEPNDDIGPVELGPLAFNGGPTETHSLPAGSAAVNHGPAEGPETDQRGVPRPVGPAPDTGAYERVLCSGLLVNVVGTEGNDSLRGSALADGILAQGGNDTVRSGAGNDKACGGEGKDKLFGDSGNDKLLGEAGNDLLDGGSGNDTCVGGPGTNELKSC